MQAVVGPLAPWPVPFTQLPSSAVGLIGAHIMGRSRTKDAATAILE